MVARTILFFLIGSTFILQSQETLITLPDISVFDNAQSKAISTLLKTNIDTSLKALENPITQSMQDQMIGNLVVDFPFFDEGMLQAFVLERYCDQAANKNKVDDFVLQYMLYNTAWYALKTVQKINRAPEANFKGFVYRKSIINNTLMKAQSIFGYRFFKDQIPLKDFIYTAWLNIYSELNYFTQRAHAQDFSPHVMFNICCKLSHIHDMAYNRSERLYWSETAVPWDVLYSLYTQHPSNREAYQRAIEKDTNEISPIIKRYRNVGRTVDFDAVQQWSQKSLYILPIITKNLIGINTLTWYKAKNFCLTGFGLDVSSVHNNVYESITRFAFHDITHYSAPVIWEMGGKIPFNHLTLFSDTVVKVLEDIISKYKQQTEMLNYKDILGKAMVTLFFVIHELITKTELYDPSNKAKRQSIDVRLEEYFRKPRYTSRFKMRPIVSANDLSEYLFTVSDACYIMHTINRSFGKDLIAANLSLNNNQLKRLNTNDKYKNNITYDEMFLIMKKIILRIAQGWNYVVDTYGELFQGTLPYLKATDEKLKELHEATLQNSSIAES